MGENGRPEFDVAVVGAGPAGCSAALNLAQHGVRVVLIEKAALPRYKTCGGGLLRRARQLLPASAAKAVERECFSAELNFHGLNFVTTRQEPVIFMTMRAKLDHILASEAQGAGTRLMEACAVQKIGRVNDLVEIDTTSGPLRAKFVIAADGANSIVAKLAGWKELRKRIPALEYEVAVNGTQFERLSQTARFDFGVVPQGYAWVFPKRAHLSIGVLTLRRGGVNLAEALNKYLSLLGLQETDRIERHGYVIPVGLRNEPLARGRIFLTGDAAGLVDPVTAEGITNAVRSGQLAAQSLLDSAFDPTRAVAQYESHLRTEILPELKAGRFLAWILYTRPRLCAWLFRKHGPKLSEFVTDVVMGNRTYTDALRKPANYFKLLPIWHGLHANG